MEKKYVIYWLEYVINSLNIRQDDRPDYQIARKWRNNHDPTGTIGGSLFHLHNPTFTGNPLMGNSGSISGGSFFNFSENKSKKNQEEVLYFIQLELLFFVMFLMNFNLQNNNEEPKW